MGIGAIAIASTSTSVRILVSVIFKNTFADAKGHAFVAMATTTGLLHIGNVAGGPPSFPTDCDCGGQRSDSSSTTWVDAASTPAPQLLGREWAT